MNIQAPHNFKLALEKEEAKKLSQNVEAAKAWVKTGQKLKLPLTRDELVAMIREGREGRK